MNAFTFQGPPGHVFSIAQDATGAIGSKLYPGALLLCQYLAHAPLPRGATVLELGAGACGLPSFWLSRSGCRVLATDAPAVLPLLEANIAANRASEDPERPLRCAPLQWGSGSAAAALPALLAPGEPLQYIVAADVVYHDEFIAPLLAALLELTSAPAHAPEPWAPPLILLSYVQRFKRARRFFKLAAAHFEVEVLAGAGRGGPAGSGAPGGGLCVDYDTLSWALPRVLGGEGGRGAPPHIEAACASLDAYCALVLQRAAERAAAPVPGGAEAGQEGAGGAGAPSLSAASSTSKHGIDSDSEDEYEQSQACARAFAQTVGRGEGGEGGEGGGRRGGMQR